MIKISYSGYRFPPEIIQHAIWLYLRFTLSFRDVEDLLAERGIMVSYETVRRWVNHFGRAVRFIFGRPAKESRIEPGSRQSRFEPRQALPREGAPRNGPEGDGADCGIHDRLYVAP